MQFYRDTNGTFHPTQALAKATKLSFKGIEVPTDKPGLCEFLNLMNPPPEYLPQIRDIMSRPPGELAQGEPTEQLFSEVLEQAPTEDLEPYREGEPSGIFAKSRDPAAIFNCTFCGKQNRNFAKKD